MDGHGWPKTDCRWILDWRPCAEWAGQIDDPDAYRVDRSGTYHGSFSGQARLVRADGPLALQHQVYDAAANRTTFELVIPQPAANHGLIILEFGTPGGRPPIRRTAASAISACSAPATLRTPGRCSPPNI